jgi:membrane-associated protease RseP (regulator of RpoE activity)
MTDPKVNSDASPSTPDEVISPPAAPWPDATAALRRAVQEVMDLQDVTLADRQMHLRLRGRLLIPAEQAFYRLRPQFEALGFTPQLKHEDGLDVVWALPVVFRRQGRRVPWINLAALIATVISVFYIGVQQELYIGILMAISIQITGVVPEGIPADLVPSAAQFQAALMTGFLYTVALLGILGAHEMGHYLMARRHKVDVTLPFFIPLPINILGTMGAVIAMREPAPNRRIQFDIGIAGPLAGLIVAVPVMIAGLLLSPVGTTESFISQMPESVQGDIVFYQEGQSLAYLALKYAVFGRVLPGDGLDVLIHPVAFAAWAGLLVTMLNLLPVGQLDGGHVLFGLFGRKADLARWPIVGVLVIMAAAGTLAEIGIINLGFGWSGWWLWVFMLILLVRRHAPVLDEITELDPRRRALGVMMLVIFILIFTPSPIVINAGPLAEAARALLV